MLLVKKELSVDWLKSDLEYTQCSYILGRVQIFHIIIFTLNFTFKAKKFLVLKILYIDVHIHIDEKYWEKICALAGIWTSDLRFYAPAS